MFDVAEVHLALNRNSHGDGLFEDVLDVQAELQKQRDECERKEKRKNYRVNMNYNKIYL